LPLRREAPATPDDLFARLDAMGIAYALHHHPPVFTVDESRALDISIDAMPCRNMFLRDAKGAQVLLTATNATKVNLKALPEILGCKRLSFGSESRLLAALGTAPGSVSPFAVLNDAARAVTAVLDAAMLAAPRVAVHPLVNTMTIALAPADLVRFMGACHAPPRIMTLPS
jgi:Ala-tRNA(Pro) deacylase